MNNIIQTKNFITARLHHCLTHEDGVIISKSAAEKFSGFKTFIVRKRVPKAEYQILVSENKDDIKNIISNYKDLISSNETFVCRGAIGVNLFSNEYTMSKYSGIVTRIEIQEHSEITNLLTVHILKKFNIEKGSKITDLHSKLTTF